MRCTCIHQSQATTQSTREGERLTHRKCIDVRISCPTAQTPALTLTCCKHCESCAPCGSTINTLHALRLLQPVYGYGLTCCNQLQASWKQLTCTCAYDTSCIVVLRTNKVLPTIPHSIRSFHTRGQTRTAAEEVQNRQGPKQEAEVGQVLFRGALLVRQTQHLWISCATHICSA